MIRLAEIRGAVSFAARQSKAERYLRLLEAGKSGSDWQHD
jgi:hypothetical protein